MSKVLVTGGAGFIGSHLVERLLAEGREVYVVDDLSTGSLENLRAVRSHPRLHVTVESVLNFPMLNTVMSRVREVVHLAAVSSVAISRSEPGLTYRVNFLGARPFFYANQLSMADLAVYSMLNTMRGDVMPGSAVALAQRPTLVAFMARVEAVTGG